MQQSPSPSSRQTYKQMILSEVEAKMDAYWDALLGTGEIDNGYDEEDDGGEPYDEYGDDGNDFPSSSDSDSQQGKTPLIRATYLSERSQPWWYLS